MHLVRLASLVFGRPHFVTPAAARSIVLALDGKLGGPITIDANGFIGDEQVEISASGYPKRKGYRLTPSGVAVLSLQGELVNRGAYVGASSGLVSYEGVTQSLRTIRREGKARALLIDCDSPGGEANGMSECAAEVRAIAAEMPVVAVANALMCSAAYGICAASTRIVTAKMAFVGSIGCVMMHADFSAHLVKEGVKVTMIHAGAHKVDGNPYQPLPDAVRADYEAMAARYYDDFVATVAAGRPSLSDKTIRATEARIYHGADAVAAGLADAVGTFETALADLEAQITAKSAPSKSAASPTRSTASAGAKSMDKTHTQADVDAARADGMTAGVTAERGRIAAIIQSPEAVANAALAAHFVTNGASAADAIAAMKAAGPAAKPVAATAPASVMGLELAGPTPATNAKPKAVVDTDAIYAARQRRA